MELPANFPMPVAVCFAMNIQLWTFGSQVAHMRKKIFNQDFMKKQFGKQHQEHLGEEVPYGGYPDTGSGLYSQKLSYEDWYKFNVLQRIHLNYVESINLATTSVLAAGLYRPKEAAIIGLVYMLGRACFSFGYKKKKGAMNVMRIFGVGISMLAIVSNLGIFAYHFVKYIKK